MSPNTYGMQDRSCQDFVPLIGREQRWSWARWYQVQRGANSCSFLCESEGGRGLLFASLCLPFLSWPLSSGVRGNGCSIRPSHCCPDHAPAAHKHAQAPSQQDGAWPGSTHPSSTLAPLQPAAACSSEPLYAAFISLNKALAQSTCLPLLAVAPSKCPFTRAALYGTYLCAEDPCDSHLHSPLAVRSLLSQYFSSKSYMCALTCVPCFPITHLLQTPLNICSLLSGNLLFTVFLTQCHTFICALVPRPLSPFAPSQPNMQSALTVILLSHNCLHPALYVRCWTQWSTSLTAWIGWQTLQRCGQKTYRAWAERKRVWG